MADYFGIESIEYIMGTGFLPEWMIEGADIFAECRGREGRFIAPTRIHAELTRQAA